MNENYQIADLFKKAFGIEAISYAITTEHPKVGDVKYQSIPVKSSEEAKKLSWMGTPVLFPMKFKGGDYQVYLPSGKLETKALNDFILPYTTLVDFSRAKNITKTPVLGNNGTVKEIYGFDDWKITIRGIFLDTPTMAAYEQHKELLKWENIVDSIEVGNIEHEENKNDLFRDKSIYKLTIEDISFKQPQGKQNAIPFSINACSDEPLELAL